MRFDFGLLQVRKSEYEFYHRRGYSLSDKIFTFAP